MKIQNITQADDAALGSGLDKHRVDANPTISKI